MPHPETASRAGERVGKGRVLASCAAAVLVVLVVMAGFVGMAGAIG